MSLVNSNVTLGTEALLEVQRYIDSDGYFLLRGVLAQPDIDLIRGDLERCLQGQSELDGSIRRHRDVIAAARNLIAKWPGIGEVAGCTPLQQVMVAVLGPQAGLVRALFFDKPPGASWSLPWHKDMTVAVKEHHSTSQQFSKPTTKAGVPHVEAPTWLLERMLTARIHLDDVTDENGPLRVLRGSHRHGKSVNGAATDRCELEVASMDEETVFARAGDVLLMRPLLDHCSGHSHQASLLHRRIIHLEYSATGELPDEYHWHDFLAIDPARQRDS